MPKRIRGFGDVIETSIDLSALGDIDLEKCRYQVLVACYDPYPLPGSMLVRRVNENATEEFFRRRYRL